MEEKISPSALACVAAAGWALLGWTLGRDVCALLLQSAVLRWAGAFWNAPALWWAVNVLSSYGVGLPLALWAMAQVPAPPRPERPPLHGRELLCCAVVLPGLLYLANLITLLGAALARVVSGAEPAPAAVFSYPPALTAVQTVLLAPLAEEWLFRGAMLRRLAPLGERGAVVASALCFALSHGSPNQLLYALVGGLMLGYVALCTGRLWCCVLLHMGVNAAALLLPRLGRVGEGVTLLLLLAGCALAWPLWRGWPLAADTVPVGGWWRKGGVVLAFLYTAARMALG